MYLKNTAINYANLDIAKIAAIRADNRLKNMRKSDIQRKSGIFWRHCIALPISVYNRSVAENKKNGQGA